MIEIEIIPTVSIRGGTQSMIRFVNPSSGSYDLVGYLVKQFNKSMPDG